MAARSRVVPGPCVFLFFFRSGPTGPVNFSFFFASGFPGRVVFSFRVSGSGFRVSAGPGHYPNILDLVSRE